MKQVVIENPVLNPSYDRLQRALRTDINKSAWSALYSTTYYPF